MRLKLGNEMLSERLREGTDIYFECLVDGQPEAREVTWLHNERPINETNWWQASESGRAGSSLASGQVGASARIIVSNNSLVLQRVAPEQAGQYACMASNSEGVGLSNRLELRVMRK